MVHKSALIQLLAYNSSMHSQAQIAAPEAADIAGLDPVQLLALVRSQGQAIAHLQHQLDWFKRQLFGAKSIRPTQYI